MGGHGKKWRRGDTPEAAPGHSLDAHDAGYESGIRRAKSLTFLASAVGRRNAEDRDDSYHFDT